jgi:hypothetical protein
MLVKRVNPVRPTLPHGKSQWYDTVLNVQVEYFVSNNFGEQMYNSCKVNLVPMGSWKLTYGAADHICWRTLA